MPMEADIIKIKKGIIYAISEIPISQTSTIQGPIDLTPKACPKIIALVQLLTGASLTFGVHGRHTFPINGLTDYIVYEEVVTTSKVIEIPANYFKIYYLDWITDASTTAQLYIFFEYDYDLIK
ncbi:TPA_asm: hypothetical protein ES702_05911 [Lokiarchaeia virus SkuldV3]|uniref:Uncharacterized protein n=1 Tax=Lokiarchaeia virus SkuldV3 TaxID=2983915 RepID=A0A9N7AB85_9VIRU|nr:hypothetical protein QKT74_gp08 [Lokiarchaeia virus SkuldV3]DAZ90948.1 TPA_asm: hypothetical protein ES702_05911 [Lokiarchaeia virus SkuldV3]